MTLDDDVGRLARTRPFSLLPREAVQLIAFACEKRRLKAGDTLFLAGETADFGYFVHSGAIALLADGAEPNGERRVGAGALIGESALYAHDCAPGWRASSRGCGRDGDPARDVSARAD